MSRVSQPPDIWRGVKVAAFVTLLGPPIGALLLLALGSGRVLLSNGFEPFGSMNVAALATTVAWVCMFSYIFGGLPALLSGAAFGVRAAKGQTSGIAVTLVIVSAALLITAAVFRFFPLRDGPSGNAFGLVIMLAPMAFASAIVCRWLMIKIRLLPRI